MSTSPARNLAVPIAVGVVVVGALVLAMLLTGSDDSPEPAPMPDNVTVDIEGDPLPDFSGEPDQAVGMVAPNAGGADFDGTPVIISNDGRPKVVLFLAHWCPHCQREVPRVQNYLEDTGFPQAVDLLSVTSGYSPSAANWPPSEWLAREGWTVPVLVDDEQSSVFAAYGGTAYPYYVLIAADGTVALRATGEQDPALLAQIMETLAGG
jgi:cytochrome c biogenesis protein CcmG/thiol:disulfide interchange protein DsbE